MRYFLYCIILSVQLCTSYALISRKVTETFGISSECDLYYNIWDESGTFKFVYPDYTHDYYNYSGSGFYYNHSECYSILIEPNTSAACKYEAISNNETIKQGQTQGVDFFHFGNCSLPLCKNKSELFLYDVYDKVKYKIISESRIEKGYIEYENSGLFCFDVSSCIQLIANVDYVLLDGKDIFRRRVEGLATFGNCSDAKKDYAFLIDAASDGGGFNYTLRVDDQTSEYYITEGNASYVTLDHNECNIINGTGNATYTLLKRGSLISEGYHTDYYSIGKCACDYKPLFFSSSLRGQQIIQLLSSIWGMTAFTNVTSAQYTAACWLIKYDGQKLSASDINITQRYILALLFYSTNGWNWNKNYYFLSSRNECDWNENGHGVVCNSEGRAIDISLGTSLALLI